jgi:hypothetical protein
LRFRRTKKPVKTRRIFMVRSLLAQVTAKRVLKQYARATPPAASPFVFLAAGLQASVLSKNLALKLRKITRRIKRANAGSARFFLRRITIA